MWRWSGGEFRVIVVPKHFFERLNNIEFYGMGFNIPSDVEDYLAYRYGEDWRVPKKGGLFQQPITSLDFTY